MRTSSSRKSPPNFDNWKLVINVSKSHHTATTTQKIK